MHTKKLSLVFDTLIPSYLPKHSNTQRKVKNFTYAAADTCPGDLRKRIEISKIILSYLPLNGLEPPPYFD